MERGKRRYDNHHSVANRPSVDKKDCTKWANNRPNVDQNFLVVKHVDKWTWVTFFRSRFGKIFAPLFCPHCDIAVMNNLRGL